MRDEFRASWDKWVWIFTVIVIGVLGVVPVGIIANALTGGKGNTEGPIALAALMLIILAVIYLFSPQAYTIESGRLTVQRPGTDVTIPLNTVERVEVGGGWQVFRGALRLFASGGPFGFYGNFWNSTLKGFTAYATRMDKVVVLYRKIGNPIVVSPDDAEGFVRAVRRGMGRKV